MAIMGVRVSYVPCPIAVVMGPFMGGIHGNYVCHGLLLGIWDILWVVSMALCVLGLVMCHVLLLWILGLAWAVSMTIIYVMFCCRAIFMAMICVRFGYVLLLEICDL